MLNSINAANAALHSLQEHDFHNPEHRAIFCCMKMIAKADQKIEPLTLSVLLEKHFPGKYDPSYLFGLKLHALGDFNEVAIFIDEIKKASQYRQMITSSQALITEAANQSKSPQELQNTLLANFENILTGADLKSTKQMHELLENDFFDSGKSYLSFLEDQMEKSRQGIYTFRGIPTGFSRLDDYLSGLCNGHFVIVGARPGVGKTTFILNLIYKLCVEKNVKVGFFSLEMTAHECTHKLLSIAAGIDAERAFRGKISPEEFQDFVTAAKRLEKVPLWIDESESLFANQLIARAKRWKSAHGIEVLFVDYLGEVRGEGKFASKQEEIQVVSKSLRGLAKKLKIPVVCICQLNRQSEKETRPPRKSDLRESGQIEADAHSILLLHRPSVDDQNDRPGRVSMHIVKNRFGQEGVLQFAFEGKTGRFFEQDYKPNPNEPLDL